MKEAIAILKNKGLKVTEQRANVLAKLLTHHKPLPLNELQDNLQSINRITLYRILMDLEKGDLIRIFFSLEGNKYIEAKHKKNNNSHNINNAIHLHFQCQLCDEVFCLDKIRIEGLPEGFQLFSDKTVLAGNCNNCFLTEF
jgi:Fur family transcriptional regulator, ferric uptake regulator